MKSRLISLLFISEYILFLDYPRQKNGIIQQNSIIIYT